MTGQSCPCCHGPVMTFGRFIIFAELFRSYKCPDCGAEVKRTPAVWLLLAFILVCYLIGKVAFVEIASKYGVSETLFLTLALAVTLVLFVVLVVLMKIISYKFIPWKEVPAASAKKPQS